MDEGYVGTLTIGNAGSLWFPFHLRGATVKRGASDQRRFRGVAPVVTHGRRLHRDDLLTDCRVHGHDRHEVFDGGSAADRDGEHLDHLAGLFSEDMDPEDPVRSAIYDD